MHLLTEDCQQATYLLEQLDGKNAILKYMRQLPLVLGFARQEAPLGIVPLMNGSDTQTVVTPRVFSIAQHLFHPLLFVDGGRCLPPQQEIINPPLLHPDDPSKVSWGSSIPGNHASQQMYSSICIDGVVYKVSSSSFIISSSF